MYIVKWVVTLLAVGLVFVANCAEQNFCDEPVFLESEPSQSQEDLNPSSSTAVPTYGISNSRESVSTAIVFIATPSASSSDGIISTQPVEETHSDITPLQSVTSNTVIALEATPVITSSPEVLKTSQTTESVNTTPEAAVSTAIAKDSASPTQALLTGAHATIPAAMALCVPHATFCPSKSNATSYAYVSSVPTTTTSSVDHSSAMQTVTTSLTRTTTIMTATTRTSLSPAVLETESLPMTSYVNQTLSSSAHQRRRRNCSGQASKESLSSHVPSHHTSSARAVTANERVTATATATTTTTSTSHPIRSSHTSSLSSGKKTISSAVASDSATAMSSGSRRLARGSGHASLVGMVPAFMLGSAILLLC